MKLVKTRSIFQNIQQQIFNNMFIEGKNFKNSYIYFLTGAFLGAPFPLPAVAFVFFCKARFLARVCCLLFRIGLYRRFNNFLYSSVRILFLIDLTRFSLKRSKSVNSAR